MELFTVPSLFWLLSLLNQSNSLVINKAEIKYRIPTTKISKHIIFINLEILIP